MKKEEIQLSKTITLTSNEISNEKIVLEKARLEENQEIQALRRLEEKKGSLQKDLELSEQKEIMAKFELTELKRLHDDLVAELEVMKNENTNIVNPVLNQIRDEVSCTNMLLIYDGTYLFVARFKISQVNLMMLAKTLPKSPLRKIFSFPRSLSLKSFLRRKRNIITR